MFIQCDTSIDVTTQVAYMLCKIQEHSTLGPGVRTREENPVSCRSGCAMYDICPHLNPTGERES